MWELGLRPRNSFFWEYLFRIFGIVSLQCKQREFSGCSLKLSQLEKGVTLLNISLIYYIQNNLLYFAYTANEGPVKILYKCLVPIYVYPEMKLFFPEQNFHVLSPSS